MKISVITPSYNHGQYIARTIESVIAQKGNFDLEYLIIDGASSDNTVELIRRYAQQDSRIFWVSEPDRGQTHAINKGLQRATGDIVAYLNSDDVYEDGALQKVCEAFGRHPDAQWASGKCRMIDENDNIIRQPIVAYKNFFLKRSSYPLLLILNFISQPSTFWRKNLLNTVGYLAESEHLVMDYEYWCRIGKKYPLHVIDENLSFFRYYQTSKSGSLYTKQFTREATIILKHTKNPFIILLHIAHVAMIISVYKTLFVIRNLNRRKKVLNE